MEIDDSLTFTSLNQHYHVRLDEVERVERIETDAGKTTLAVVIVVGLVVTALYLLGSSIADGLGGSQ